MNARKRGGKKKMSEIESHIKNILFKTFEYLYGIYPAEGTLFTNDGPRRLIFPSYSDEEKDGEISVSEQELRFAFVDVLNDYCQNDDNNASNLRYSVETPTNGKYRFKDTDNPHIDDNGISGNMDLVIHDESGERLCLIEFKANNPEPKDIEKDLVKLTNIEERDKETKKPILRYFIGLVKSTQPERTINNIKDKLNNIRIKTKDTRNNEKVHIIFFNLTDKKTLHEELFEFKKRSYNETSSSDTLTEWLSNIQQ